MAGPCRGGACDQQRAWRTLTGAASSLHMGIMGLGGSGSLKTRSLQFAVTTQMCDDLVVSCASRSKQVRYENIGSD